MKIALISNWRDTCGVAIYGENLVKYAVDDLDYHVIPPSSLDYAKKQLEGCDIVHINHHEGHINTFGFSIPEFIKETKLPVILTNHTTEYVAPWFADVKVIVTHIPALKSLFRSNSVVYQPILDLKLPDPVKGPDLVISQAGFPFAWKWYDKISQAAEDIAKEFSDLSVKVRFYMPTTYHGDASKEINKCNSILNCAKGEFITEWMNDDDLIRDMHTNSSVCVYYTDEKREGPSASVRMGIASLHPTVVNGNAYQYQDILNEPGIYPCYNDSDLAKVILLAYEGNRSPKFLVKKESYEVVSQQYKEIYQGLLQ